MDIEAYGEHVQLFGLNNIRLGSEATDADYRVIVVHLEWNLIFPCWRGQNTDGI